MTTSPQLISVRRAVLGEGLGIDRALPSRQLRTIGAWCFLDHLGPVRVQNGQGGIDVGPHPHIGLQTFTWMIKGHIWHQDSLGFKQLISPKQVNLMTSGEGIVHTEETPADTQDELLHSVQLWIALPEGHKHIGPAFEHYPELPQFQHDGVDIILLVGSLLGHTSPVRLHSALLATELYATEAKTVRLPLQPEFEYGVMVLEGQADVNDTLSLDNQTLVYLPVGGDSLTLRLGANTRVFVLAGEPLAQSPLLWWNFVADDHETVAAAREDWVSGAPRFGDVVGYAGERMAAPELVGRLKRK
ncbi:MAG: pirin family protein [Neisseriaceae bacterium]|nr:pirin family protein [Neisseriaceae bacterium]